MTVRGPVNSSELGLVLPHEHVLVDFASIDEIKPGRYDPDEVFEVALPYLVELRAAGCQTLVEATPNYLGRDPELLRRLSEAADVHILTNTGYYGARRDQHLPAHTFSDTPDELARRWIREWEQGIDETGIRPGFMKLGFDGGPLTDVERKLIEAGAETHKQTGLSIAAHTGPAISAMEQLDLLEGAGVHPSAWIWVHAQGEPDGAHHVTAARRGAWVEFDGVSPDTIEQHVPLVSNMKENGLLDRTLVSHDAGWYNVGDPRGGEFRGYLTLINDFIPALRSAGFTRDDVEQLVVSNPAAAFTIGVRTL